MREQTTPGVWLGPLVVSAVAGVKKWDLVQREERRRVRRRWRMSISALMLSVGVAALMAAVVRPALESSRQSRCRENLQQIGLALLQYHETHRHLPAAAITDDRGQTLLSWRVAILPDLGRRDLYDQFRLDQPWDSPHNRALLAKMPKVFACPSESGHNVGITTYRVLYGREGPFDGAKPLFDRTRGVDLREVLDGTNNTIMVAETGQPVPWTKPEELFFAEDKPMPRFSSRHASGFNALFADGTVRFLKFELQAGIVRALITRDGSEGFG
ncbi:MAG TPA: DUF1559 domain-containing protein [Isosphaeraceae bacterium]|nr:DUF1559 domain-containing protein [Isosphaeraceae bacterium]